MIALVGAVLLLAGCGQNTGTDTDASTLHLRSSSGGLDFIAAR
jgi:hypothetical protein